MNRVRELLVGLSLLKTPIRRSGRWIDDRGGNSLFLIGRPRAVQYLLEAE